MSVAVKFADNNIRPSNQKDTGLIGIMCDPMNCLYLWSTR